MAALPATAATPRSPESYVELALVQVDRQRPAAAPVQQVFHATMRTLCCGPSVGHLDEIHPQMPMPPVHRLYGIVAELASDTRGVNRVDGYVEGADLALLGTATAPLLTVDAFRSEASADCRVGARGSGTRLSGVRVNGVLLPAEIPPNLVVDLGSASAVLNEQRVSADGLGITVTAIHLLPGPLARVDVAIGRVAAAVTCPGGTRIRPVPAEVTVAQRWTTAVPDSVSTWTVHIMNRAVRPCVVTRVTLIAPVGDWRVDGAPGGPTVEAGEHGGTYYLRPEGVTIAPGGTFTQTIRVRAPRRRRSARQRYASGVDVQCASPSESGPVFEGGVVL